MKPSVRKPQPDKLVLDDLAGLRKAFSQERARREAEQKQAEAAARRQAAEADVFRQAVGQVQPLRANERILAARPKPSPLPVQSLRDEQEALRSSLSDDFVPLNLLEADGALSFQRPGIGNDVLRKLRAGHWVVQAQIDLHGLRRDEAREALAIFLRNALRRGHRCLRVIHGKGLGSPGKEPVLKNKVRHWLTQKEEVIAFVEARAHDGGSGALIILLKPSASPLQN